MHPSLRRLVYSLCATLALSVGAAGCATVPEEAVVLSDAVGQRIAVVQASHEQFVSAYFGLSRERVEDFLQDRWIPTFLATFYADAQAAGLFELPDEAAAAQRDRVLAEIEAALVLPEEERAALLAAIERGLGSDAGATDPMQDFMMAAAEQIEAERRVLLGQLDQLERDALRELRATYAQLLQMQSTVTAYLAARKDVDDQQDRVLDRLGLLGTRDQAVQRVVDLNDRVVTLTEQGDAAADVVLQIRELLGLPSSGDG